LILNEIKDGWQSADITDHPIEKAAIPSSSKVTLFFKFLSSLDFMPKYHFLIAVRTLNITYQGLYRKVNVTALGSGLVN